MLGVLSARNQQHGLKHLASATSNGNYSLLREAKHNEYAHSRHIKVTYFLGVSGALPYIMNREGLVQKTTGNKPRRNS